MDTLDSSEQLAGLLRADLRRGEYHPRERLVESELVSRYGFPRATVRSALLLLAADGLIERSPNRGASVRSLSIDEGIELAEVRRELEALCARDAAARADRDERRLLRAGTDALRYILETDDLHSYRQASIAFHESIITMSRHEVARRQLAGIRHHNLQRHFPTAFQIGPWSDSAADHIEIAEAIVAGEPEAAERAMHSHLDRVVKFLQDHRAATRDRQV